MAAFVLDLGVVAHLSPRGLVLDRPLVGFYFRFDFQEAGRDGWDREG